jgi:hypothetical protein
VWCDVYCVLWFQFKNTVAGQRDSFWVQIIKGVAAIGRYRVAHRGGWLGRIGWKGRAQMYHSEQLAAL